MFRIKSRLDRLHEEAAARLAEFDAAHPQTVALYQRITDERHEREPDPDCEACQLSALDEADRMFLTAHGWIEPKHS